MIRYAFVWKFNVYADKFLSPSILSTARNSAILCCMASDKDLPHQTSLTNLIYEKYLKDHCKLKQDIKGSLECISFTSDFWSNPNLHHLLRRRPIFVTITGPEAWRSPIGYLPSVMMVKMLVKPCMILWRRLVHIERWPLSILSRLLVLTTCCRWAMLETITLQWRKFSGVVPRMVFNLTPMEIGLGKVIPVFFDAD